ncbi:MAG TPA: MG2 domain-containing protein [Myxococcaceae bacterium]|nr:MG2 domain-containing protein [Myxococcaceae bacterium]
MSHFDDDALLRYRFDTLGRDQALELAEHLRRCADCTSRYADLCRDVDGLGQYTAEPADPDGLLRRALESVQGEPKKATEPERPAARKVTPYPGLPRAAAPAPEPEPEEPEREGTPILELLGVRRGARGRIARLAAAAAMLLTVAYAGLGTAYYAARKVRVNTQLSAEARWLAGGDAAATVRVQDMGTGAMVEGADVELALQCGGLRTPLGTVKTGPGGVASPTFLVPDMNAACALEARTRALGERDLARLEVAVERQFRIHLGTDKPLYQPGQTIHIRALALQHPSQAPAENQALDFVVRDPKGNRLILEQRVLGKFGVASLPFQLADDVPLGDYTIEALVGGATQTIRVKVDRYALPKFNVAVLPEKDAYLAGETLRATVRARYFFGKPVAGAEVHAMLVSAAGEVLGKEIAGRTTNEGELRVEVELPATLAAGGGESVSVQAQVKDAAGQEERKEQAVSVSRDTLRVDVLAADNGISPGVQNELYVLTSTPDGRPVAAGVELFDRNSGKTLHATTGARGVALVHVRSDRAPSYEVTAEASDGRRASQAVTLPLHHRSISMSADKALYRPGETVKVRVEVQWDSNISTVFLDGFRDGQTVLHQEAAVQPDPTMTGPGRGSFATGGTATFEVRLPPALTGSLELAASPSPATRPGGGPVSTLGWTSRWIAVAEPRALSVTIAPDQPEYRPGSEAKLRFEVKDAQGKPTAASLGVAVVDESLFARVADLPQQARAAFLLEQAMLPTLRGISAPEVLSSGDWTAEEQAAASALFSMVATQVRPQARVEETYRDKQQRWAAERDAFEERARVAGLVAGIAIALAALVALLRAKLGLGGQVIAAGLAGAGCWVAFQEPVLVGVVFLGALVAAAARGPSGRPVRRALRYVGAAVLVLLALFGAFVLLMERRAYELSPSLDPRANQGQEAQTSVSFGQSAMRRERGEMLAKKTPGPASGLSTVFGADDAVGMTIGLGGAGAQMRMRPLSGPSKPSAANAVRTTDLETSSPPRRIARVREHFPETMFVRPELIADERGVAELTIPVADSITAWRVTAFASSAQGKIGSAQAPLKVFQDFFVDVDAPPALVQGDEAEVPVAVYNYLSERQAVRLEVQREEWFELIGPQTVTFQVAPGGLEGKPLRLRALRPGKHKLTLRADGTRTSDAVARELLVSERGRQVVDAFSGELAAGVAVRRAVVVPDQVPGSLLTLKLYPTRTALALDGLEGSLQMPHGCFEQTSSTHYPNVLIYDALKRSGHLTAEMEERARGYISAGYQRLLTFEVPGGGFEWFGRAPANQVLTAYGLLELSDMARLFPVDPNVLTRTQRFLEMRQQADGSWMPDAHSLSDGLWRSEYAGRVTVTAYIAWALAESGAKGPALGRALDYLARNLDQTDDAYADALATAAFSRAGHPSAATAARRLAARAVREETRVKFTPAAATAYYGRGAGGTVETTAMAAMALRGGQAEADLVRGAGEYLIHSRVAGGAWPSTQATILALRALLLQSAEQDRDTTVRVKVNGADAGTFALQAGATQATVIELGVKARRGQNVVELEGDGKAGYQLLSSYVLPWRQRGDEESEPLSLQVAYGRTSLRVGDVLPVTVKLTYRRPDASGMTMVQLGLPAGLVPILDDLAALRSAGKLARYEPDARTISLYLDRITAGAPVELSLRLKARGRVRTSGVESRAYLYYAPEISAAAPPLALAVN